MSSNRKVRLTIIWIYGFSTATFSSISVLNHFKCNKGSLDCRVDSTSLTKFYLPSASICTDYNLPHLYMFLVNLFTCCLGIVTSGNTSRLDHHTDCFVRFCLLVYILNTVHSVLWYRVFYLQNRHIAHTTVRFISMLCILCVCVCVCVYVCVHRLFL